MGKLMNANFDIHLEGYQIELEVVEIPIDHSPIWLFCSKRKGTRV